LRSVEGKIAEEKGKKENQEFDAADLSLARSIDP